MVAGNSFQMVGAEKTKGMSTTIFTFLVQEGIHNVVKPDDMP